MVTGIVLVNVERQYLNRVIKDILALDGVTEVYAVAGEYDLAVMVRVHDNAALSDIVANKMPHDIQGICHTKTLISLAAHSDYNLDEIFG
jgi:DNA-binding Lrp family transcriptional regulator